MLGFLNNSVRVYPVKLRIGMLYHTNNTFFQISVNVPLIVPPDLKEVIHPIILKTINNWRNVFNKNDHTWMESLLNCVTYMLKTCSRANVPCVLTSPRANVPCVLTCSRANVISVLACSRAKAPYVLTCSHA